jgi:hypothetical protein
MEIAGSGGDGTRVGEGMNYELRIGNYELRIIRNSKFVIRN